MSTIDFEIEEIKKLCQNVVENSKIITCTPVLVRVDIIQTNSRQLSVCLRFPENYPQSPILVEIKSRTLSGKFLDALANLAEKKAKEILGKPQVIHVLKFIEHYLKENPLCVAYDEILNLKKSLGSNANELLKLKQKTSSVHLVVKGGHYFYKVKADVPIDYPKQCVVLRDAETNLPAVLLRYLNGQSKEIARQCVEPPLRVTKDKSAQPFQPVPSLYKSLQFCIDATLDFYEEKCPICDEAVLPKDSTDLITDDTSDMHCERVYCGHLFHQGCLKKYLQEPPFPKGGKNCPAKKRHPRSDSSYSNNLKAMMNNEEMTCGIRLAHDRWVLNVKVAETRWAQKQARVRELEEVADFLQ
ncbi:uncharacterized protein LOC129906811 [Episyrphus balteatus]|uniref:uncharacterized protein LOC129906811 n=1 Tax=Episyrphus balteatus TaxID=286459 RepID=UPI002485A6BA|nr:uncharacterized protein LOC129906811 [Episyrphus balteatus]